MKKYLTLLVIVLLFIGFYFLRGCEELSGNKQADTKRMEMKIMEDGALDDVEMISIENEKKKTKSEVNIQELMVKDINPLHYQMEGDKVWGSKDAPVTIVEYSSFSCPHCATFHNKVLENLENDYIKTGKVKLISRPIPFNEASLYGAMIAECSGDNYYDFVSMLFEAQESWVFEPQFMDKLGDIARLNGMSKKEFDTCVANDNLKNEIRMTSATSARALQINATPTFFVNGQKYVGGRDLATLENIIDELIEE